ncbi:MAG: flagellar protein FliT [Betaproteobacteria bacterium]|nr:flagellar protein FliT [Betaproteobacteria bacterium]
MSAIVMYETMRSISARMVEAARSNDWERLVELERDVASLRDDLVRRATREALSPDEHARKVQLIHRILADDAEVRRHTEPWMEALSPFLGHRPHR